MGLKLEDGIYEKGSFQGCVHFVIQGKGGVGKSFIASLLCQYFQSKEEEDSQGTTFGIDTDQVNHTLNKYKELNTIAINYEFDETKGSDYIPPLFFDEITEKIFAFAEERKKEGKERINIIVDVGASVFSSVFQWMKETSSVELFNEVGLAVKIHTILTGGQAKQDTNAGLRSLCDYFTKRNEETNEFIRRYEDTSVIVWINNYFGELKFSTKGVSREIPFQETGIYETWQNIIEDVVYLPYKSSATFGENIKEICSRNQTFIEAINDKKIGVMTRQRLRIWWLEFVERLDRLSLV